MHVAGSCERPHRKTRTRGPTAALARTSAPTPHSPRARARTQRTMCALPRMPAARPLVCAPLGARLACRSRLLRPQRGKGGRQRLSCCSSWRLGHAALASADLPELVCARNTPRKARQRHAAHFEAGAADGRGVRVCAGRHIPSINRAAPSSSEETSMCNSKVARQIDNAECRAKVLVVCAMLHGHVET